jgi:ribosomal protein L7Ae-like RNA K-turn-binding protein
MTAVVLSEDVSTNQLTAAILMLARTTIVSQILVVTTKKLNATITTNAPTITVIPKKDVNI